MPRFSSRQPRARKGESLYMVEDAAIKDIVAYATELENRADHVSRMNLHRVDASIHRLEKYTLEEVKQSGGAASPNMWPSFTSNSPRTYFNAVRRATTANQARIKVKLPGMPGRDVDLDLYNQMLIETARHEAFAYGGWAALDEHRAYRGEVPFRYQYNHYMSVRGGAFLLPWLDDESFTPFQCRIWDPMNVVYEPGDEMLDFVSHHYRAPFYQVMDRYSDKFEEDGKKYRDVRSYARGRLKVDDVGTCEVRDIWWVEKDGLGKYHVWNVVVGGSDFVLADPMEYTEFDRMPVILTRSFGVDVEGEADYRDTISEVKTAWETIYTANRDIYPWINRVMTLYGLYLRNNAIGPYIARGTNLNQDQLNNLLKPFMVTQVGKADASVAPLAGAVMAPEVKEFNALLQGAEQRGGVPNSIFGQIPFEISGFAVNQLQGAVSIVAAPLVSQMSMGMRLITDAWIRQFRKTGRRIHIEGMDGRRELFIEEIKRAEIRDKYHLEVEIPPELPTDKLQQAQVAQQWAQAGVDPLTIFDEVLNIANPREVARRAVIWQQLQLEMQQQGQAMQAQRQQSGASPEVLPPEARGIQSGFNPSSQQTSNAALEAAGFSGR